MMMSEQLNAGINRLSATGVKETHPPMRTVKQAYYGRRCQMRKEHRSDFRSHLHHDSHLLHIEL